MRKMNRKSIIYIIAGLIISAVFISCGNGLENTDTKDDGTYLVITNTTLARGVSTINPNVTDETIQEMLDSLTTFTLTGNYTGYSDARTLASAATYEELCGMKIPILAGEWTNLTLKAYYNLGGSFNVTFSESKSGTTVIKPGIENPISFSLSSSSYGGMSLKMNFYDDNNNVNKVTVKAYSISSSSGSKTLLSSSSTPSKDFTSEDFTEENVGDRIKKSFTYTRQRNQSKEYLGTGTYYITFDFYKTGLETPLNSAGYFVNVAGGFVTTGDLLVDINNPLSVTIHYNINDAAVTVAAGELPEGVTISGTDTLPATVIAPKSGEIVLPELEKEGFVFMGWYEDDSCETRYATNASNKQIIADGTTGSKTVCAYFLTTQLYVSESGEDDYKGFTEATATSSLSHAVSVETQLWEKMNAVNRTPSVFTFNISGTVNGSASFNGTKYARKIRIVGKNDGTSIISSSHGYGIWCCPQNTSTVIEISNLTITNSGGSVAKGGGIYIQRGTCSLLDGVKITGNTATQGSGIYVDENGSLKMSGTAVVEPDNDIYLYSGKSILLSGPLTGTYTDPVAKITVENYSTTDAVVTGPDEYLSSAYNRFLVTPEVTGDDTTMYKVGSDGKISSSLAAGDIVFNDQTVMTYTSGLNFSDAAKAKAVGVIYNTDTGYIPRGILGKVNTHYTDATKLGWVNRSEGTSVDTYSEDLICTVSGDESTSGGKTLSSAAATGNSLDGSTHASLFRSEDSSSIYATLDYADSYGSTNFDSTSFANGWYIPSVAEMICIGKQKETLNTILTAIGGTTLGNEYWTSSLSDTSDDYGIWSVGMVHNNVYLQPFHYGNNACCVHQY